MSSTARTTNAADDRRISVSLNMIVRDEEDHLPGCLASVAGLFDELIIVDTGSADRTKAIAHAAVDRHSRPARVIEFPWTDSFADARNEAIRHSTGEWIFSIDADERIDEPNRRKLAELFGSLSDRGVAYRASVYAALPDGGFFPALGYTKLFPNRADLRWFGRVHEGLRLPGGMKIEWCDVVLLHIGYRQQGALEAKSVRNVRLLELQVEEMPTSEIALFNLARECYAIGEDEKGRGALARLERLGTEKARSLAAEVRARLMPGGRWSQIEYCDRIGGRPVGGSIIA